MNTRLAADDLADGMSSIAVAFREQGRLPATRAGVLNGVRRNFNISPMENPQRQQLLLLERAARGIPRQSGDRRR